MTCEGEGDGAEQLALPCQSFPSIELSLRQYPGLALPGNGAWCLARSQQ